MYSTVLNFKRVGWLAAGMALAGFGGSPLGPPEASCAPSDTLGNVFRASPVLPMDLRRVAVLPLSCENSSTALQEGCGTLQPVLRAALIKTRKFEVVSVKKEELRSLTGQLSWTGSETLPPDFLDSLQRVYGCDAVLFSELTMFHAYAPMTIGWRLKLVSVRTHQIIWAVDETFEAEQQNNQGTPRYRALMRQIFPTVTGTEKAWINVNSPRQFGEFAAARLLATLPDRQESSKVSP
jgi:hypothetical protein